MKHFIYAMRPDSKAPAGLGTYQEWFYRFKINVEGEVWVPVPDDQYSKSNPVEPNDVLWFAFLQSNGTAMIVGAARILRAAPDPMQARQELWYSGEHVWSGVMFPAQTVRIAGLFEIPKTLSERWLEFYTVTLPDPLPVE